MFVCLCSLLQPVDPPKPVGDPVPTGAGLVHQFVARATREFGKSPVRDRRNEHLILYSWPGNVRQSKANCGGSVWPTSTARSRRRAVEGDPAQLVPALSRVERKMIKAALKTSDGKVQSPFMAVIVVVAMPVPALACGCAPIVEVPGRSRPVSSSLEVGGPVQDHVDLVRS